MKITTYTIAILISVLFQVLYLPLKSQEIYDDLLIWYKWDNDTNDYSGNNYNPVYFNAEFAPDRFMNDSSALYFNGIDHYISLPDTNALQPEFPLSFVFWAKLVDESPEHGVIFTNDFSEYANSGSWINFSSTKRMSVSYGDGSGYGIYARRSKHSEQLIELGIWYFFAGVIHNASDIRVFINGYEDIGYFDGFAYYMMYFGESGNIGRKDVTYESFPYHYKGFLDDFRYWSRGLSNYEILNLYTEDIVAINAEYGDNLLHVYPNPVKNQLTVILNLGEDYCARLVDQFGRLIYDEENVKRIDMRDFPNGFYILKIRTSNGKYFVRKIIKH